MKFVRRMLSILTAVVLLGSILVMPAAAATDTAEPISLAVRINGTDKKFDAYVINGNSFFRMRDIAYALNGTDKQFEVSFDGLTNRTELITGAPYTPVGGEMVVYGSAHSVSVTSKLYTVSLDGKEVTMLAYVIGAYHYVKLRDLAAAVDFGVTYIASSKTIAINTSTGYTPESKVVPLSELNVSMVGDSLGIGIEPYLKKLLPLLNNNSKVSRQFYHGKAIVQEMLQSGTLAQTVIIELGTNGTVNESDLRALIDLIGPDRKIVFVNIQVPRSWCDGNNQTFAKVIPEYPNTIIADWYSASIGISSYFASDKVHPSKTGATVLSQLIADAVQQIQ